MNNNTNRKKLTDKEKNKIILIYKTYIKLNKYNNIKAFKKAFIKVIDYLFIINYISLNEYNTKSSLISDKNLTNTIHNSIFNSVDEYKLNENEKAKYDKIYNFILKEQDNINYINNPEEALHKFFTETPIKNAEKINDDLINNFKKNKIFEDVSKIINGERKDLYGNAEDCFKAIADYWTIFLKIPATSTMPIVSITPQQVAVMMTLLKIARQQHKHKRDNIIDAIGYLALLDNMEP